MSRRHPDPRGRTRHLSRWLNIGLPYLWLGLFLLFPVLILLQISLAQPEAAQPPYSPLWQWLEEGVLSIRLDFQSYQLLWEDELYLVSFLNSVIVAFWCTLLCLLLGYPMAYAIATAPSRWQLPLLMLIILPFWTSFLIRVYAWIGILKSNGFLSQLLEWLGLIDEPLAILYTPLAVYIGIVYSYLPFIILPLYANLTRLDPALREAAADLGCRPWRAFLTITLPLSRSGIIAGTLLVFIPAIGEFVIPDLLGGPETLMIGRVLWTEFFSNMDWPVAAALALVLLGLLVLPFVLMETALQSSEADRR